MFYVVIPAQSPEEAAAADRQSIAALGAVLEAERAAEVAAHQEVTAFQSVRTILAEASRTAATKAPTSKRRLERVNDDGALPEEGTRKNDRVLGSTTAITFGRRREPTVV